MENKKIILVTGATGAQGGSVARSLLAENTFTVRVLTRNIKSPKAIALQEAGAELVEGDLEDIGSLIRAMKNCYGIYGLTNFWEHYGNELRQGKNLVDAVQFSNIQHFVFHTLPDYNKLSGGKYPTPHCDIKAELQRYTKSLGIPATFIHIAFYYENFFSFFPLQPAGDGSYYFGFPQGDTKLSMVSVDDLGGVVASVFNHPAVYIGRIVDVVGADETCREYASIMSEVLQQDIRFNYITHGAYAKLEFPGAEELANMFETQRQFIPSRLIGLIESYGLNPQMQSFKQWLQKNKPAFDAHFRSIQVKEPVPA